MAKVCPACRDGMRCGPHAASYAVEAMASRGMVPIQLVDTGNLRPVTAAIDNAKMLELAAILKIEVMFWVYRYDAEKGLVNGWYVPQALAFVLATMVGRIPWDFITNVMRVVKENPEFREAYEAAWRVGGVVAANGVLDHFTPGVSFSGAIWAITPTWVP